MILTFQDKIFRVKNSRGKPAQGFIWDATNNSWITQDIRSAAHLRDHADGSAQKEIYSKYLRRTPWVGSIPTNKGLLPKKFQIAPIQFALERNRSYLWNDPGTGKGPTISLVINGMASKGPIFVVYVCPPELAWNVEDELNKWLVRTPQVEIFKPKHKIEWRDSLIRVLILPSTMIGKVDHTLLIFGEYRAVGTSQTKLIVDEAHEFKNPNAERTKNLLGYEVKGDGKYPGLADKYPSITYMTGTAMPNNCALELFPVLYHSAPETIDFKDYYGFAFEYTVGEKSDFGWKFRDIKDKEKFKSRVYGKFLYRLKKNVLDLPKRTEAALVIAADMKPKLAEMDRKILRKHSPEDLMRLSIHLKRGGKDGDEDEMHLMTYRRLLGLEKVKPVLPVIKSILEHSSVLVYAMHTEVIDELAKGLAKYDPVVIDGRIKKRDRHDAIEAFKKDTRPRPIIGNLRAMRLGFTILKCTRVFFVEWDWVPGNNDQNIDRTHRIGQTRDIYAQYALFRNSVDMKVLDAVMRKKQTGRDM